MKDNEVSGIARSGSLPQDDLGHGRAGLLIQFATRLGRGLRVRGAAGRCIKPDLATEKRWVIPNE
jgi:hypothetical protein